MIRVFLADDDELVCTGLALIIESVDDIVVVGQATTGREAVDAVVRLRPDVVLMDVQMPDGDGIAATRQICERLDGSTRVIVLTTFEQDQYVFESLRAGASGFMLKRCRPEQLLDGIRVVAAGDALLAPSVTKRLIAEFAGFSAPPPDAAESLKLLTDREREVLTYAATGSSNVEIAQQMYISESTAKTHLKRAIMKLGLRDRVAAVVYAYEVGLVRPGATADRDHEIDRPSHT